MPGRMLSRKKRRGKSLSCFLSNMRNSVSSATRRISQWLPGVRCANPFRSRSHSRPRNSDSTNCRSEVLVNPPMNNITEAITSNNIIDHRNAILINSSVNNENIANDDLMDCRSITPVNSQFSNTTDDIIYNADSIYILESPDAELHEGGISIVLFRRRHDDNSFSFQINYWPNMSSFLDSPICTLCNPASCGFIMTGLITYFPDQTDEGGNIIHPSPMINNDSNLSINMDIEENIDEPSNDYTSNSSSGPSCKVCGDSWLELQHKKHLMCLNCGHIFCNICVSEMKRRFQPCSKCGKKITSAKKLYF